MDNIKPIIDALSYMALGLMILATAIVQLTPTKADDKALDAFVKKLHKYLSFFPTLGQNPITKEVLKKAEEQKIE